MLACAQATGLLEVLPTLIPEEKEDAARRLSQSRDVSRQQMLQTLLFMPVANVYRPYDLRSYTGDALGLLSERPQAFGYVHTERFLSQLAQAGADKSATAVLSQWVAEVWQHDETTVYYVDGHRKPVYSKVRVPRGLIGRTGKILGARALTLLNDEQGHPLVVTTARGDQHLTEGLPEVWQQFRPYLPVSQRPIIVADRECMAADFLASWQSDYRFITLLKSNQYQGLESFQQVGDFVPLKVNEQGDVWQEVAEACYELTVPSQADPLLLSVALIQDHQRPEASTPSADNDLDAYYPPPWKGFSSEDWTPHPTPAANTQPKLIPIVATEPVADALTLVTLYRQRWAAQENVIKDFLLPLGLDVNHGYAKQLVDNSEFRKQIDALTQKAERLDRWRRSALQRSARASRRYRRLHTQLQVYSDEQYRLLNNQLGQLDTYAPDYYPQRSRLRDFQREIDAEIRRRSATMWDAFRQSNHEFAKAKRYAKKQCEIQRTLLDLEQQVCDMFELDNRKDQLMSMLKVALTNLIMWTRHHFFPETYSHATWKRLQPFFRLPGRIRTTDSLCEVTLRPFNDRALNRDLHQLCHAVNDANLLLPSGLHLRFYI